MQKTSKVTNVSDAGHYEAGGKRKNKVEVTFENGDKGQYSFEEATQTYFVIGQEANYEIWEFKGYWNVKPAEQKKAWGGKKNNYNSPERLEFDKEKFSFEKKKQIMIMQQSCIDYAIKYLAATKKEFTLSDVVETKDQLYANIIDNLPKKSANGQE